MPKRTDPATGLVIRRVAIDYPVQDPANARLHDDRNRAAIRSSLVEFGQVEPLVLQRSTHRIIGGNARHLEMLALGWTECDVVEVEVSDDAATALAVTLNRTAELATWAPDNLMNALATMRVEFPDFAATMFTPEESAALSPIVPSFQPAPEPTTRLDQRAPITCPECGHEF